MSIFNFLVNDIFGIRSENAESIFYIGREYDSEPLLLFGYLRMIIHSYSVMSSHSTIESFSDPITSFNTFFFFCSQETRKHYADTLKSFSVQCIVQTLNQSNHH